MPNPSTIALALVLRRMNASLRLRDALDASRYLLSVSQSELARYHRDGFTSCVNSLRTMAILWRMPTV